MRVELVNEFHSKNNIGGTNTSYVSDRVAPVSTKTISVSQTKQTSNVRDSANNALQRSIPKGLVDSQTSFNMTLNASYVKRLEKTSFFEEKRSYNTSKRSNKAENEDEVNFAEESLNPENPESTYPQPTNKGGRVRRNRNMRGDKIQPQPYSSNRLVSSLYSKSRAVKN